MAPHGMQCVTCCYQHLFGGARSYACNNAVGGASNSQHLYGRSADLTGAPSLCTMARQARYHGFGGIFGPGYPGHSDHTHARHPHLELLVRLPVRRLTA